ncbi:protein ELYS [Trichonephila clavipes]|nr:protein ELYS [Trichonephila clavipes]
MTLHSPTENSLAVLNHKILEANSQVQNVKLGGHLTCLSINRLWHKLCDMLRRLVGTQLLDIMIVHSGIKKLVIMALYRSPLTVTLWPSSFLKKYGSMIPPAHKAHQTVSFSGYNGVSTYTCGLASLQMHGLWLYLVHDTVIDVYCTESGKWCGGHCFEESLRNPSAKITAAVEFTSSHISYPCLLLAVNHDDESLLCLFDVNSCKVVRAVIIPDRVTSLDVVSGNGGVCKDTHNLSRRLRFMFGIIAVGTLHGHIFFLDLCLDENFTSNENSPSIAVVVKKQDFSAEKREAAIAKKQHILLHLNVESSSGGSFEFKSRSSTLGHFPNADVYVTAVKYIPSLTTLAVGFNFGGIQLWELHHLSLQFTIANDHEQAIVNFAFQEPENDPRNFCYLWVFKGHSVAEEELPSTISVATLYSLTYFRRDFVESFGALYTELQTCNRRFELPLTNIGSSLHSATAGSRLMSCQIINEKDMHHNTLKAVTANESDSVSENMSLCFLSWEVWPNSDRLPPSYHLAVFDLNQWYQAHMPAGFR